MEDIIVLLRDVGANYYNGRKDYLMKQWLNNSGTRFLCIHGNHEMRPVNISVYIETEWCGGKGWLQPEYPNLVFAKDGEIYTMNGLQYLIIGGAYSVDKYYRLSRGWSWWPDEQPSPEIKAYTEMFLGGIDQRTVDDSTERWLDTIEESIQYKAWFCGHWHTDKRIDKMHFLFRSFESDEQFKR